MENPQQINFKDLFIKLRIPLFVFLSGLILLGVGIIFYKSNAFSSTNVEVISGEVEGLATKNLIVEISGAVQKPGVYKMNSDARVNDLLIASGGLTLSADKAFIDKYLNKASKLTDGQKFYIPQLGEESAKTNGVDQTGSSSFSAKTDVLVNINTASLKELDTLPGIGQTFGQNIIDHRPYSSLQELVSKGAIKQSLFDKIKDKISVY